jgi:predicted alpha/beta-fold hydrolase
MLPHQLGLAPFRPRAPWWNGDLQTLRDTLRPVALPPDTGLPLEIAVGGGDGLLALQDRPAGDQEPLGLVVLLHGLGGSSEREGLRRMGWALQQAGFGVLRLNLRGADPGRHLAPGTYAASCNPDLLPVLRHARTLAARRPLLGMGISLGGTMLLNALLEEPGGLDGLVCISSPLDLAACSQQIERPRNGIYQRWLLKRLVAQTLADPFGIDPGEEQALRAGGGPHTIRAFDAAITAPRWGYSSVEHYYAAASPLQRLLHQTAPLPPLLLVHAKDDPWVPVAAAQQVAERGVLQVLLTDQGGHNGFHAVCDGPEGNWGDRLTARWFRQLLGVPLAVLPVPGP